MFLLSYNHDDYPIIDHKISIINGFKLGLTADQIGNIENLCITKENSTSKRAHLMMMSFQN